MTTLVTGAGLIGTAFAQNALARGEQHRVDHREEHGRQHRAANGAEEDRQVALHFDEAGLESRFRHGAGRMGTGGEDRIDARPDDLGRLSRFEQ